VDVESLLGPETPLARQLLAASAEDHALEDALYALEQAVGQGALRPEVYLRQVRQLARRQFFARATASKAAEAAGGAAGAAR
jgi:ESCRT-I complex subunit TSG101